MSLTDFKPLVRLYNWWHGTRIRRTGPGHRLHAGNARMRGTTVEFYGREGIVELADNVRLFNCKIMLRGTGPKLVIGNGVRLNGVSIVVEDRHSRLEIDESTTMTGARLQCMEGGLVRIGRDCMIGTSVDISNSDVHSVIDAVSGERINQASDILLEDHVWVGSDTKITKGSLIGTGSIIAARSRVKGTIPAGVIAAGNPAAVKRIGVNWDRRRLGIES